MAALDKGCNQCQNLAILMISTNGYLDRWKITAESLQRCMTHSQFKVRIHLFTDAGSEAKNWAKKNLKSISLTVTEIPSYGWPEATLFRYEIFEMFQEQITDDLIMYLDSDMKITGDFTSELSPESWESGLAFVQHPGFYQIQEEVKKKSGKSLYALMLKIKYSKFFRGGYGDWEDNKKSTAFTAKKLRKVYVHGAVWFGKREEIFKMVRHLNKNVKLDYEKSYIAKWHDESHLNWYFANCGGSMLTSKFSGFEGYPYVMELSPMIFSEIKEKGEGRSPGNLGQI